MIYEELNKLSRLEKNDPTEVEFLQNGKIKVYPKSVITLDKTTYFIGNIDFEKKLFLLSEDETAIVESFDGEYCELLKSELKLKCCPLNHKNALLIQGLFDFTRPVLLGISNSFGFGDRLGYANSAHVRSLEGSDFKPVLAQQSIRELTRTQRTPEEVMDVAVWAVFQEGYKKGFGADADHLKTTEDIDLMINAGFTMFTFDPGDYVINEADSLTVPELEEKTKELNWSSLDDSLEELMTRYEDKEFKISDDFSIKADKEALLRATVKYADSIAHIKNLFDYLNDNYANLPFEVEISVDETDSVTTPFEHFFMASELNRLGVKFVSLAPRFIGDFEKGIDYKGDMDIFTEEYLKHIKITEYFGSYKISLHSGSDKFGVYKAIGSLKRGYTHVKTAGTSYLEALRVIAFAEPEEFRKILDYSREQFEIEKKTYHISADINNVHSSENYNNEQLLDLLNQDDARQVLHVTYGKVLTTKDESGNYLFKDKVYDCLVKNEDVHFNYLIKHFHKHLNPFK